MRVAEERGEVAARAVAESAEEALYSSARALAERILPNPAVATSEEPLGTPHV